MPQTEHTIWPAKIERLYEALQTLGYHPTKIGGEQACADEKKRRVRENEDRSIELRWETIYPARGLKTDKSIDTKKSLISTDMVKDYLELFR